ncbi:MAG: hypothetical protein ABJA74_05230 [Lapillicoccus sp.]
MAAQSWPGRTRMVPCPGERVEGIRTIGRSGAAPVPAVPAIDRLEVAAQRRDDAHFVARGDEQRVAPVAVV